MINQQRSFDVKNGVVIKGHGNGRVGIFYGDVVPSSVDDGSVYVGSIYIRTNGELWQKFSPLSADWKLLGTGSSGGSVLSVNGQTGNVVITASSINAEPLGSVASLQAIVDAHINDASIHGNGHWDYALLRDVRPLGENGGTSREKKWNDRVLNEITYDSSNIVTSLVDDVFVLANGTYRVVIKCPADHVDEHKVRLVDAVTEQTIFEGVGIKSEDIGVAEATGVVHVTNSNGYFVQHYTRKKKEKEGLGEALGVGNEEIYTTVEITKVK